MFEFDPTDRPCIAQLAGNTPGPIIALANSELLKGNVDGIDLNCGCPQGFALEKNYGCALLGHPDLLTNLCRDIVQGISLPLSVKMRLHEDVPTTIKLIERLIGVGVKAISIHGRYWWQKGEKRGLADWDSIQKIRAYFPDFPIIGNGDILKFSDFADYQAKSGVVSTMAGYGALLNPGIFSETSIPINVMLQDYLEIARKHENKLIGIQRHIAWMLKRHTPADFKASLFKCKNIPDIVYAPFLAVAVPVTLTFQFFISTLLGGLETPILVNIPPLKPGEVDRILYPSWAKDVQDMSASERKKHLKRQEKHEVRMNRKREREKATLLESTEVRNEPDTMDPSAKKLTLPVLANSMYG